MSVRLFRRTGHPTGLKRHCCSRRQDAVDNGHLDESLKLIGTTPYVLHGLDVLRLADRGVETIWCSKLLNGMRIVHLRMSARKSGSRQSEHFRA